jgi:hypothetical protein
MSKDPSIGIRKNERGIKDETKTTKQNKKDKDKVKSHARSPHCQHKTPAKKSQSLETSTNPKHPL